MKLITSVTLGLLTTSSLYASTTMCFKENHQSMTTIETIALDGGECASLKSVQDMKKDGWIIDDIKIESSQNGKNYIYIFKKDNITTSMDEEKLEERIMQKLENRKIEEAKAKIVEVKNKMSKNGKDIYINQCQRCHGKKAELEAYNTSRALINLNLEDFQQSIRDYTIGEYDRGAAMVMKPYANNLNTKKIKDVYSYIKSLKPKEMESK